MAQAFLQRQEKTVIRLRSAVIQLCDPGVVLSLRCVLQKQDPPLIRVARWVIDSVDRARAESQESSGIQLLAAIM